jgi:hypothetical protein
MELHQLAKNGGHGLAWRQRDRRGASEKRDGNDETASDECKLHHPPFEDETNVV